MNSVSDSDNSILAREAASLRFENGTMKKKHERSSEIYF